MTDYETRLFINNEFVPSSHGKKFATVNPANEKVITEVYEASEDDVNAAVAAAKEAFKPSSEWRTMEPKVRGQLLFKVADLIEKYRDELVTLETLDNGKPAGRDGLKYGSTMDIQLAINFFRYFAGWCDKITGDTIPTNSSRIMMTMKEPVGVCGLIVPWNFPFLMATWKIAPCLATGCTFVLKSSEKTPLSALVMARILKEAGIPKGVCNIVSGAGNVGTWIAMHNDIRKIAFTGSTPVGHKIQEMASKSNLKRVTLELGGKNPLIICHDADVEKAVATANLALFLNQGQVCTAGSRLFVHEDIYEDFVKKATEAAKALKTGDGNDESNNHGPQVDDIQFKRIMGYIEKGKKEGARLCTGGDRFGNTGYFIQPTVFADVTDDMTIAKEEIFGPVQSILKYKSYDEVLERANNTEFGLAAGVIGKDITTVMKLAKGLEAGTVWVNTYDEFDACAPFGGYKQSGHGRDKGKEALNNYLETKTIMFPIA
eukprot:snap_masked-scaffold_38-processed-gene-1.47-mRNA-1 protein AED:0.26 eAED:0.26 QI:83/1/1/1/0.5/0.33/3/107/486